MKMRDRTDYQIKPIARGRGRRIRMVVNVIKVKVVDELSSRLPPG